MKTIQGRPGLVPGLLAATLLLAGCSDGAGSAGADGHSAAEPQQEQSGGRLAKSSPEPQELDTGVDLSQMPRYEGAETVIPERSVPLDPTPPANRADQGTGRPQLPTSAARISLVEGQEETADFGEVQQGFAATHTFRLISDGEEDLVISRLKASCGCTEAGVKIIGENDERTVYRTGQPIPVGTEFEVETSLLTEGRQGSMSTYVTIYSNEAKGYFNLHLKANVKPVLHLQPSHTLNFGSITSAERVEGKLTITSDVLEPFALTLDEQFVVDPLSAELVPCDPTEEGKARTWELRLTLGPKSPEGLRNYPLRLITDVPLPNPKNAREGVVPMFEARAFVQANVTGLVSAQPSFLSFGMVRPGQPVERSVKVTAHDDFVLSAESPVRLTGLRGDEFPYVESFSWELVKQEDGSMTLLLNLEGMPEGLNGSFGGVVTIAVGHPMKEELQVRFSGVCREGLPGQTALPVQRAKVQPTPKQESSEESHEDSHDHDH